MSKFRVIVQSQNGTWASGKTLYRTHSEANAWCDKLRARATTNRAYVVRLRVKAKRSK